MAPAGRGRWLGLVVLGLLASGCASGPPPVARALKVDPGDKARAPGSDAPYLVRSPDKLDLHVEDRPELTGRFPVGSDGCLELGRLGRRRVEGMTTKEIALEIARAGDVPVNQVRLQVAEYQSQQIYLLGEVFGLHRAVAYQGPETVLELHQRAGGLTPGAAPEDVHVIRAHLAEGGAPEVFPVDLKAILFRNDRTTNIRLQPFDQVYVGQTRRAVLAKCVPPWLRSAVRSLGGLLLSW